MPAVREIMTEQVVVVPQNANVAEAAKKMKDENVGTVVIIDSNNKLVGLVTDRKLTTDILATGKDPNNTKVREVMTDSPATASPEADVCDTVEEMGEQQIRRVPVVDQENKIVGVMSTADVAKEHAIGCRDCTTTILEISSRYV